MVWNEYFWRQIWVFRLTFTWFWAVYASKSGLKSVFHFKRFIKSVKIIQIISKSPNSQWASFLNGLLWKGADSEWLFSDQRSLFRVKYAIKSYCIERGPLTNSNRIKIASQDHKLNANRIIKDTARYSHAETKI